MKAADQWPHSAMATAWHLK